MKLHLDYDKKTIILPESCKLVDFIKTIQNILPNWEEWELLPNTVTLTNTIIKEAAQNPFKDFVKIRRDYQQSWYTSPSCVEYLAGNNKEINLKGAYSLDISE